MITGEAKRRHSVMSAVDYDTGKRAGAYKLGDGTNDHLVGVRKLRYRGWLLIGLGLSSWAGLLKLCGLY